MLTSKELESTAKVSEKPPDAQDTQRICIVGPAPRLVRMDTPYTIRKGKARHTKKNATLLANQVRESSSQRTSPA
jgi:hypothetical protein